MKNSPALEEWQKLYNLMAQIKELGFSLKKQSRLKEIDRAKRELRKFTNSMRL